MGLRDDLFAIEQGFWTGGEDYFRAHLDEDCLIAFPGKDPLRWKGLETQHKVFRHPIEDLAMLAYEARADQR